VISASGTAFFPDVVGKVKYAVMVRHMDKVNNAS